MFGFRGSSAIGFLFFLLLCGSLGFYARYYLKVGRWYSLLKKDFPGNLSTVTNDHFLGLVTFLLQAQGCKTELLKSIHSGVEILASRSGKKFATMAIISEHKLSDKVVISVVEGAKQLGCSNKMIITNSTFSETAIALAKEKKVKLADVNTLNNWAQAAIEARNRDKLATNHQSK